VTLPFPGVIRLSIVCDKAELKEIDKSIISMSAHLAITTNCSKIEKELPMPEIEPKGTALKMVLTS